MKQSPSLSFVFCLLLFTSIQAQQAWQWQNPLPQGNDLESVYSFNQTTAIAVGAIGIIIKTTNGGCSWEFKNSGTKEGLKDVFFVDSQTGWIAGDNGIILKTGDGGGTWIIQNSTPVYSLNAIHFINANTGWAVGTFGKILKTTDGGSTWVTSSFGASTLSSVCFTDENHGWICGWFGSILKTTDGGITWAPVAVSATDNFYSLCFTDNLNGVAVGTGYIARTTDGGATWPLVQNAPSLNSVCLLDNGKGWAVGVGRAYAFTENGGLSWVYEPGNGAYRHLLSVSAANEYSVWAVGEYGNIFESTSGLVNLVPVSTGTTDELRDICFVDQDNGWIAGGKANPFSGPTMYKTTNGGIHWIPVDLPGDNTLFGLDFIDKNTGWAVGSDGLIFKTTDGGNSWSVHLTDNQDWLYDIFFLNEDLGWIVGSGGTILKTTDAGANWTHKTSGSYATLSAVYFVNENVGWAVGPDGKIIKTTDGGDNWQPQSSGFTFLLSDVFFHDENNGWITGGSGRLLKTADGGTTWTPQLIAPGTSNDFSSVYFLDQNNGWVCDSYGIIMKTTDGGLNWILEEQKMHHGLNAIYFIDKNTGWTAGNGGTILRFGEGIKTGNLSHNSINLGITDFNTTEDIIYSYNDKSYLDFNKLLDVEVLLDTVLHSSDGDLVISLNHAGITDTLVNKKGVDGDNFINTRLYDASPDLLSSGSAPFTGNFKPDYPIKSFIGLDPNGEWKLRIYDGAPGNTGTLQAWGLKLYFGVVTGIENETENHPKDFVLYPNYPNPFNSTTRISWQLADRSHVLLKVCDFLGREIRKLVDENQVAGKHQVMFDAEGFPVGVYFYQLQAGAMVETRKMVIYK